MKIISTQIFPVRIDVVKNNKKTYLRKLFSDGTFAWSFVEPKRLRLLVGKFDPIKLEKDYQHISLLSYLQSYVNRIENKNE